MVNSSSRLVLGGSWANTAASHFMPLGTGFMSGPDTTETKSQTIFRSAGILSKMLYNVLRERKDCCSY